MESLDFGKLFWGLVFVAYGVIYVRTSLKNKNRSNNPTPQSEEDEGYTPAELEQIFREEKQREAEFTQAKRVAVPRKNRTIPVVEPKMESEVVKSSIVGESDEKRESGVDFDLRQAVIMSELLNPKFKEE